jgi:hypothetical protein
MNGGTNMEMGQLLAQVLDFFNHFGDMPLPGKISGLVLLLLSLWKTSFLQPYWKQLGAWRALVPPVLGIILALVNVRPLTLETLAQSAMGGALAIALHEMFTTVKSIPGLGGFYVRLINAVEAFLRSPNAIQAQAVAANAEEPKKLEG